jgi:hypothetical protein
MAIHVTQIDRHKFVCGLFWQALSRPRELVKEAREIARKIDFDLMVLRADQSTAQAGYAQTKDGAKSGLYSLAAAVSKTLALEGAYYDGQQQRVHNWLGAFKLPDGMWAYFAVRDASFLPNGDFAGTREEVLERLHGDYGLGGWNAVIGDAELEDYGFHNFNAKRIHELLPHASGGHVRVQKWWGLRPVKRTVPKQAIAAGAALLVLAGAAGAVYWKKLQAEKEAFERERAFAAARQQVLAQSGNPPAPWAAKPAPRALAQACATRFTHLTAGGWRLDDYVCSTDGATYIWTRHDSTVAFLREQVPDAEVDLGGNKAVYSTHIELAKGAEDALLDKKTLIDPLLSTLQLMHIALQLTPAPAPAAGSAAGKDAAAPPPWKAYSFSLQAGGVAPADIAAILDRPGVRIEKFIYRNGAWSIEGVMYAK